MATASATNTLIQQKKKPTFSAAINAPSVQDMILKSLKDTGAAARFTSTLISVVSASDQLKSCDPGTIIAAALRGEGAGLTINMGYYVVPYGTAATFIIGYKGLIQLAMATGRYADIDCTDVREGEYKGRNRRTGKPDIDFNFYASDAEREAAPIIGYYAYFELKDGYFRGNYMSTLSLLEHADHYSAAFDLNKYDSMVSGELDEKEVARLRKGSPWYDVGGGQERMMKKTVLRELLSSGYAPLSNDARYEISNDKDYMETKDNTSDIVGVSDILDTTKRIEAPTDAVSADFFADESVTVEAGDEK